MNNVSIFSHDQVTHDIRWLPFNYQGVGGGEWSFSIGQIIYFTLFILQNLIFTTQE